jgi:hypothetical protein
MGTHNPADFVPDLNTPQRDGREKITLYREQRKINLSSIP